jgi:hypothetical protein
MANLRILYKEHDSRDGWLISISKFESGRGAHYRVLLDLNEKQFYIRNEYSKEFVVKSVKYGNLNVLKRNARAALGKLGVAIGRECRNRTFGLCEKGTTQKKVIEEKAKSHPQRTDN